MSCLTNPNLAISPLSDLQLPQNLWVASLISVVNGTGKRHQAAPARRLVHLAMWYGGAALLFKRAFGSMTRETNEAVQQLP